MNVIQFIGGTATSTFKIEPGGQVTIGDIANLTGLGIHELGLRNARSLKGFNQGGTQSYSLIHFDVNDMVRLGADSQSSGVGHVAIPKDTTGTIPAAGATRNGLILIDETNNRFCFYANNNRYFVGGTPF
jgi:hypothetical protein